MSEKEILENNKLIAEFMGGLWNIHSNKIGIGNASYCDYKEKKNVVRALNHYAIEELKYHSSWDWLMEVIKKCLSELDFLLRKNIKDEYTNDDWEHMSIIAGYKEKFKWCFERPIKEKCFNLTVEFIKLYNQNK